MGGIGPTISEQAPGARGYACAHFPQQLKVMCGGKDVDSVSHDQDIVTLG
jgi:hypothetical protein